MLKLVIQRLLWAIPTLFFVFLTVFVLTLHAPGDPVASYLGLPPDLNLQNEYRARLYKLSAHDLGLDQPTFFFAVQPRFMPDTLHRILPLSHRKWLQQLAGQTGHWQPVEALYRAYNQACHQIDSIAPNDSTPRQLLMACLNTTNLSELDSIVAQLPHAVGLTMSKALQQIKQRPAEKMLLPRFVWYGSPNRFTTYFSRVFTGQLGRSLIDRRPVADKIKRALPVSLILGLPVWVVAFLLSIPWALQLARRQLHTGRARWLHALPIIQTMPVFLTATLLIALFATPDFGLKIFPSGGLSTARYNQSVWVQIMRSLSYFILPWFCLLYGTLTYLTYVLAGQLLVNYNRPYAHTARAKGLSTARVLNRHILPNALTVHITLLGQSLPHVLAGSLIIETIFNLPGMGSLSYTAVLQHDWPVVFGCLLIVSLATIIGLMITDILRYYFEPGTRVF